MKAHGTWWWLITVLFVGCLIEGAGFAANYPIKIHPSNPHLLADQDNKPFLLHGDAAWGLMVMLDKAEAEQYLENRREKGFNTLLVMLISKHVWINNGATVNHFGQEPFMTPRDLTRPNAAYFDHVDWVIDRAAQKGMQLVLAPCYIGYYNSGLEGWNDVVLANGTNACRAFGRYVGQRYKDKPNLIWLDYGDNSDAAYLPHVRALALGIREFDTNHLHTAKMFPQQSARDYLRGESWFNLNTTYAYGDEWIWTRKVYDMSLQDYNATPVMASFLIESHYEGENTEEIPGGVPAWWVRRQAYWSVLCGSSGQIMGEHHIWPYLDGWQAAMDSESSVGEMFVRKLFDTRPWHAMVPDQNHSVVTSGYGTFGQNDYLTAMRATNGSTVIAYMPSGRSVRVAMNKVSGTQARGWWYDPRDGTATNFGTFATTGTNTFTPADTNDWVLVLDDAAANFIAPGSGSGPLEILTGSIPPGSVGTDYSIDFLARGGTPPYVWSVATNSALPAGLNLTPCGLFSGTPSNPGSFQFDVQLTDAAPTNVKQTLRFAIQDRDATPPATPGSLAAFAASCRDMQLTWGASTDNVSTVTYEVERRGGTNPCFMQITNTTGTSLRDAGLAPGTSYQFRVRASDSSGNFSGFTGIAEAITLPAPDVPPGLVAGYGFNENSGTQTRDAADNGNIGNISGAVWTNSGKFGSALAFNGSNSLVLIGAAPSLNLSTGMTLEAWVYPTASQSGWRTIIQRETDAYILHAGSGSATLRPAGGGTIGGAVVWTNATTALSLNTWTHLAVTYDGSMVRLFVNGAQSAGKAAAGNIQTNANPLRIGGNSPYGEYFIGRIDEVRIFNRSRSQTEIQSDMASPVEPAVTNTAPTLSTIADQVINAGTVVGPLDFTIADAESPATNLALHALPSDPVLVPSNNIVVGGSGSNRTVLITPAPGRNGSATIMLNASDGQFTTSSYFDLTVNAATNPPAPIVITSVTLTESNHLRFTGTGDANTAYTIQTSDDLINWLDTGSVNSDSNGMFEFVDEEAADRAARFYRVILQL